MEWPARPQLVGGGGVSVQLDDPCMAPSKHLNSAIDLVAPELTAIDLVAPELTTIDLLWPGKLVASSV